VRLEAEFQVADQQRHQQRRHERDDRGAETAVTDHHHAAERQRRRDHVHGADQQPTGRNLECGQMPRPADRQRRAEDEEQQLHRRRIASIDGIVDGHAREPSHRRSDGSADGAQQRLDEVVDGTHRRLASMEKREK
jgi:hypothetical protein